LLPFVIPTQQLARNRHLCEGQRFIRLTPESTRFVHELFTQYGDKISELEVRRASLEDTYLTLVRQVESGHSERGARELEEVAS
jgi:ABC-2 type transport system ATP-binding protein